MSKLLVIKILIPTDFGILGIKSKCLRIHCIILVSSLPIF